MKLELNELLKLIEEVETELILLKEEPLDSDSVKKAKEIAGKTTSGVGDSDEVPLKVLKLPRFRLSNEWGKPGSSDRALIEKFFKQIKGKTVEDKLNSISNLLNSCRQGKCEKTRSVARILGNIAFLDSISSILYEFNAQAGGSLFESFITTIMGGSARLAPYLGSTYPIEDIIDNDDTPASIKLIRKEKEVKGSLKGFLNGVAKYDAPIRYIVALKTMDDQNVAEINFYDFSIGIEPGIDIPVQLRKNEQVIAKNLIKVPENWRGTINYSPGVSWAPPPPKTAEPSDTETSELESEDSDEDMEDSLGEAKKKEKKPKERKPVSSKTQFYIPESLFADKRFANLVLGSPEEIQEVAQTYVQMLQDSVVDIYDSLDAFTESITRYFLKSDHKDSILKAREHAAILKTKAEVLPTDLRKL